jgi:hypothetical protein
VFKQLSKVDANYTYCPTKKEWDKILAIWYFPSIFNLGVYIHFSFLLYDTLRLFFVFLATGQLGMMNHPIAHLTYKTMKKINKKLKNSLASLLPHILDMIDQPMQETFDKYWSEMEEFAAMIQAFDPCYKFEQLEFILSDKLGHDEAKR